MCVCFFMLIMILGKVEYSQQKKRVCNQVGIGKHEVILNNTNVAGD